MKHMTVAASEKSFQEVFNHLYSGILCNSLKHAERFYLTEERRK